MSKYLNQKDLQQLRRLLLGDGRSPADVERLFKGPPQLVAESYQHYYQGLTAADRNRLFANADRLKRNPLGAALAFPLTLIVSYRNSLSLPRSKMWHGAAVAVAEARCLPGNLLPSYCLPICSGSTVISPLANSVRLLSLSAWLCWLTSIHDYAP